MKIYLDQCVGNLFLVKYFLIKKKLENKPPCPKPKK